jgi:hypothetical protein
MGPIEEPQSAQLAIAEADRPMNVVSKRYVEIDSKKRQSMKAMYPNQPPRQLIYKKRQKQKRDHDFECSGEISDH